MKFLEEIMAQVEDAPKPATMDPDSKPVTDDGSVMKKVLTKGSGWDHPKMHDEVFINFVGRHGETVFDSNTDENGTRALLLGSGYCKGLEVAIMKMQKGEFARVDLAARAAFAEKGWEAKGVPADANVQFEVELVSWHSYDHETMNRTKGGVRVKMVETGRDTLTPKDDDLVYLKFRGKLPISSNYFISKGWDADEAPERCLLKDVTPTGLCEGIKAMKLGSQAKITLTSEYAFGKEGNREYNVQPGAKVEYEVELLNVRKLVDAIGDGGVMVELHEKTTGAWMKPVPGDKCKVSFSCSVGEGESAKVVVEHKEVECDVGADNGEDFTDGVEAAIEQLVDGQTAHVVTQPQYGYGEQGKQGLVEPGQVITYVVTLHSTEQAPRGQGLTVAQCKELADSLRQKGNEAFKAGRTQKALRVYNAALDPVRYLSTLMDHGEQQLKPADKELADAARTSVFLNLSACHDRLQNWSESVENCRQALKVAPQNRKARFRRAKAYMNQGRLLDAKSDLDALLPGDPKDKEVLSLLAEVKRRQKEEDQEQKNEFTKMFKF